MQADFRLQDPTEPPRSSLVDILTDLITGPDIAVVRGFFGFATGQGLNVLLSDDSVRRFFMRGNAELIVGLDSITDPPALTKLQEIERRNPNFRPRVVVNTSGALVHPKFIDVRRH